MEDCELKNIVFEFEDFKFHYRDYIIYRTKARKEQRRMKSVLKNYTFIKDIIGIDSKGFNLEYAVRNCLLNMGFKHINKPKNKGEEDIQIVFDNSVIITEITGTEKKNLKESKMLQVAKWLPFRRKEFDGFDVSSLLIVNHDNRTHYKSREDPFLKRQIALAQAHNVGVITTTELLKGFLLFKGGKIGSKEIKEKLKSSGLIFFDD